MKATMIGFDSIRSETNEMVITGGQESLSNTPFVLGRNAPAYGGDKIKGIDKKFYDPSLAHFNNIKNKI